MKKPTGKNSWRILLVLTTLATLCSCHKDKYSTKLVYENTLQQNLKLEIFHDYQGKKLRRAFNIAPGASERMEIIVYEGENIFYDYFGCIGLTFEDGKSILYHVKNFDESPTSLMNSSNYSRSQEEISIMHIKITEDHYREAIESEDKKGES